MRNGGRLFGLTALVVAWATVLPASDFDDSVATSGAGSELVACATELAAFDRATAQWSLLPIRRDTAERMLQDPAFAARYEALHRQAAWLRSDDAQEIAGALALQVAELRSHFTGDLLAKREPVLPPTSLTLLRAEIDVGIRVPAAVRLTVLEGMPELRPEPLVEGIPRVMPSGAEDFVRATLTRTEIMDLARRLTPLGGQVLKSASINLAVRTVAHRLVEVYDAAGGRLHEELGHFPWRATTFRETFARRMDEAAVRLKCRKLQIAFIGWIFQFTEANVVDEWTGDVFLDAMQLKLDLDAHVLAKAFAAATRPPSPASPPPPPTTAKGTPSPAIGLPPKRQRVESLEERAQRIARQEAERLAAEASPAAPEPERALVTPPPPVSEKPRRTLEEIVATYAMDELAARQIRAALELPALGASNRDCMLRTLERLLDGTPTFQLRPNLRNAHPFGIWEIRPQSSSNFRLTLQLAGRRPYLIALEDVKASHHRQVDFFRESRRRWDEFRRPPSRH